MSEQEQIASLRMKLARANDQFRFIRWYIKNRMSSGSTFDSDFKEFMEQKVKPTPQGRFFQDADEDKQYF